MRNHGKQLLGIALLLCCLLALTACSAVSGVEQKISNIGTVTLEKQTAIEEAEAAFNALSTDEQAKVSNYETLQAARAVLDELLAVSNVEQQINSIETVTLEKQTAIEEAEAAFNALSADEQAKVSNYETLQAARTTLDKLIEADKEEKEKRARELKDQQDAVSLAEKIITVMGTTFKSPMNLTVENIWYRHTKFDTVESWDFTFQISAPNGYGNYVNEYYSMTLFDDDIADPDSKLKEEVRSIRILGMGVLWRKNAITMQYGGTQMSATDVQSVQSYYIKHVKSY